MNSPLVSVTIAFSLGVLLSAWLPWYGAAMLVAGGALILVCLERRFVVFPWRIIGLLGLWMSLGILRVAVWHMHPDMRLKEVLPNESQPVMLHGLVVSDPIELFEPGQVEESNQRPATSDKEIEQVYVLSLRHVRTADGWPHHPPGFAESEPPLRGSPLASRQVVGWQPIRGRVRTTIDQPRELLQYGDEVLVAGRWSLVAAPSNPGQYDWRATLARQRIHGILRVKPYDGVVRLEHGGSLWMRLALWVRHRWQMRIEHVFHGEEVGLLRSVLLGQRVALDERLKQAFVETGTVHLLVISGFNVGLVAILLEGFCRLVGLPWRLRLAAVAAGLGAYCLISGAQPPVVRATLMAWMVLGAMAMDRVIHWWNLLAAAALMILWVEPVQLFDPSFQLSFGAVASLLALVPRWRRWLEPRTQSLRPRWLVRYVVLSLAATGAIWLGLSPLLAYHFHLISPVSVLANLLIAPLMSGLIAIGTGLLMLGTWCEPLLHWTRGLLSLLLAATIHCVQWCHALPGSSWYVGHPSIPLLIGYYGLVMASLHRPRFRLTTGRLLACWMLGIALWAWAHVVQHGLDSRWLRLDVLDVGHGDCLVIRTPRGQVLVVDAGTQEAGRTRLVPFLRHQGIDQVDALILTHSDEDHLGGAIPLLEAVRVRRLLTNGAQDDRMSARRLRALAAAQRLHEERLIQGMMIDADPTVRIEVLHPPSGFVPGTAPASNDNSVVLKMTKGEISFLLTGDLEEAGLPWLLRSGAELRSTVLKVPHHGSRLGESGRELFDLVAPQIALISVGQLHHLPAPETMQALKRTKARVHLTQEQGAIRLRTDGTPLHTTSCSFGLD